MLLGTAIIIASVALVNTSKPETRIDGY